MAALYAISQGDTYAEDRIMNNFAGYISTEFDKGRKELADVDTESNYVQWFRNQPLWSGASSDLSSAMPLVRDLRFSCRHGSHYPCRIAVALLRHRCYLG